MDIEEWIEEAAKIAEAEKTEEFLMIRTTRDLSEEAEKTAEKETKGETNRHKVYKK